jgi:hypothetical protein
MAYNDNTVAINPDGDGNSVFYSDSNPTINGKYIGGGFTFGADGARDGHLTAEIIYGRHHIASNNGYYIMCGDRMFDTSDTYSTTQVINSSGQWVGGNIYLGGDGYITRGASSSKISIWAGGTYQGGQIDYFGGGSQTDCGTLIFRTGVGADTAPQPERMRISNTGKVGIGTTTPSHPLHIYDAGNSVYARWERSSGNMYIGSDSIGAAIGATGNIPMYFSTGDGTERMRLSCQGNLGIGQCNPLQRLAVAGNILLGDNDVSSFIHGGGNVAMSADASLLFVSDSNGTTGAVDGDIIFGGGSAINTDADRSFGYDSAYPSNNPRCEYMRIKGTGNIGIGTNSPTKKLHVNGDFAIGTGTPLGNVGLMEITEDGSAKGLSFHNGGGTTFRIYRVCDIGILGRSDNINLSINCFGNIGINSCTPGSYKLYVNGAFYAAGSSCEYKTSICQYNTDSCMFMKLTPVTYQYKDEYTHLGKELKSGTQIGLIAEDVAEVYPELAILKDEDDNKIVRNVDYEKLSIVLLSEVQKLRKELDELKTK